MFGLLLSVAFVAQCPNCQRQTVLVQPIESNIESKKPILVPQPVETKKQKIKEPILVPISPKETTLYSEIRPVSFSYMKKPSEVPNVSGKTIKPTYRIQ